jgi:hypothetical protein
LKDKIERFSKGDFEYVRPFICLSEEEINLTIEVGKRYEGNFIISNSMGSKIEGFVYSSNRRLTILNPSFCANENQILYQWDGTYLKDGDEIKAELSVVSDCGELTIPVTIILEKPYINSSIGKIKDLFQFANLARMDWSEAKKVFRSEEFKAVLLNNQERYQIIYQQLLKSISTSQAMEEFLIAIRKKSAICLKIDKTEVEYCVKDNEDIEDKLTLTKDQWGFAEIRVSTDAQFIGLEQKYLWADRFIGNTNQVSYQIIAKNLRKGNNYGHIWIKSAYQTIVVSISCKWNSNQTKYTHSLERQITHAEQRQVENYMNFRLNRIDQSKYFEVVEALLKTLSGTEFILKRDLINTHAAILKGNLKLAEELLNDIASQETILKKRSALDYCTYLYLKALYFRDQKITQSVAESIRYYYENGYYDWRILWFLLYTDKRYENNKSAKLTDIKAQYYAGCRSPILYYEAICILNEEPVLLRELSDFEIQVMNYGIRKFSITKDLAQQFIYVANKKKNYNPVIYRCLVKLYEDYKTPDILSAICCILIKGYKRAEKYFTWYQLGVEAQLRITELYEYYMYSIRYTYEKSIAHPVLLYFIYNSNLSDKKKSFLYANIIKHKSKNETVYGTYFKRMEVFASKMLEAHHINHDLAVLYREFISKGITRAETARHLSYVMYRHEFKCKNPNIISVTVVHNELNQEVTVVLEEGLAQVDIYSSNVEIILTDSFGNNYINTVDYTITPYLNAEDYEVQCLEYSNHPMLLLHIFDRYQSYRIQNDKAIALRKEVLTMEKLTEGYRNSCILTLTDYYYENYNAKEYEQYLGTLNLSLLSYEERSKYLEYMVIHFSDERIMNAFSAYGYEGVSIPRLVKFCSGWLKTRERQKKQDILISLCFYVFTRGKYDDAILIYLIKYYHGSSREMYQLWLAARGFELDTHVLEERILTQMLFAESYIANSHLVFENYYQGVSNYMLRRAYLTFNAYKYLVHEQVLHTEIFAAMKRELNYEENDICLLAWLKYHSEDRNLSKNDFQFVEYSIQRMAQKGIILPFYTRYKDKIILPNRLQDKFFVTYNADPQKQVYIHYRVLHEEEQGFITEPMNNTFMGIHCREFVLFYNEILQYYITEEAGEETVITESYNIQYDCCSPEEDESKYNQLNMMLMAYEMQDETTLLQLMENFILQEYLIDTCFKKL